jgi:hypothetical protein
MRLLIFFVNSDNYLAEPLSTQDGEAGRLSPVWVSGAFATLWKALCTHETTREQRNGFSLYLILGEF